MQSTSTGVSLAVPPTQNTAEVREYRCLYTHDIRRKAKRWQDGFLSFHTFNKRFVVFDESRNKIGDNFWREEEEFDEGVEAKLQQGALVQVENALSRREQDVTEVVAHREAGRTSAPIGELSGRPRNDGMAVAAAIKSVASGGVATQQHIAVPGRKPKSLKEVINTPAGAIGRARIPDRSPYEQRHKINSGHHVAEHPLLVFKVPGSDAASQAQTPRPRKRQRVEEPHQSIASASLVKTSLPGGKSATMAISDPRLTQAPTKRAQTSILIESDEELPNTHSSTFTPPPLSMAATAESHSTVKSIKPPGATKSRVPIQSHQEPHRAKKQFQDSSAQNISCADTRMVSTSRTDTTVLRDRPVNMLRPASSRSRRKLIHRALVPEVFVSTSTKQSQSRPATTDNAHVSSTEPNTSVPRWTDTPDLEPDSRISAVQRRKRTEIFSTPASSQRNQDNGTAPELPSNTLPQHRFSEDKAEQKNSAPNSSRSVPVQEITGPLECPEPPDYVENMMDVDEDALEMLYNEEGGRLKVGLDSAAHVVRAPLSRRQRVMPKPQQAPLVRSTTLASEIHAPVSCVKPSLRPALQRVPSDPGTPPRQLHKQKGPLQKAMSDMIGSRIGARPPEPRTIAASTVPSRENDRGPWSTEAFDLFGWRPGLPKGASDTSL